MRSVPTRPASENLHQTTRYGKMYQSAKMVRMLSLKGELLHQPQEGLEGPIIRFHLLYGFVCNIRDQNCLRAQNIGRLAAPLNLIARDAR